MKREKPLFIIKDIHVLLIQSTALLQVNVVGDHDIMCLYDYLVIHYIFHGDFISL